MTLITLTVLVGIAGLLLAGYTLVSQSLEQKRSEKRLLLGSLQRRLQQILDILSQVPPGYLNVELASFLHQQAVDCAEMLHRLERNSQYQQVLTYHRQAIQRLNTQGLPTVTRAPLQDLAQIKDLKTHLNDILVLIANSVNGGSLPRSQALQYKHYLQCLMLQINLESYQLAAQQAIAANKLQVAIHYYQQAKKILGANPANRNNPKQEMELLEQKINALNEKLAGSSTPTPSKSPQDQEKSPVKPNPKDTHVPHSVFNSEDAEWKKKQIYD